jgi:hypothetical protein
MAKEYVEKVMWDDIKQDCKVSSDDNDGYQYGLYLIDFENEGDIIEVYWFKTNEERDDFILENKFIVVFDIVD